MDATKDVIDQLAKVYWITDPEQKAKTIKDFLAGPYPQFLNALNQRLVESGQYQHLAGDKISSADFLFSGLIFTLIYNDQKAADWDILRVIFEKYEALAKYAENMKVLFKDYLETRPKCAR